MKESFRILNEVCSSNILNMCNFAINEQIKLINLWKIFF